MARRIRATFETVESLLTNEEVRALFSTRALFFALFAAIYGLQFEIRTPVKIGEWETLKREAARPLAAGLADQVKLAAGQIREKTAPPEVLEATRGAVTDLGTRRTVIEHLVGKGNSPCPLLP